MTSTDLDLKRTLTDILEDELYNINYHNQNSKKNVLELSLPTEVDEAMLNRDFWNEPHPHHHSPPHPHHLGHHHQPDQQIAWNQSQEGNINDDNNIFNKYADPSLTMTSSHHKDHVSNVAMTPVQSTVNLNNVMKVTNPFQNMRYQLPFDIKITNNYHDEGDSIYDLQPDEDTIGFDGFSNPKMHWPLQDNNIALSTEDARMIFDHEFAADDDLSDDEDDNTYDDGNRKVFGACDFVDGAKLFGIRDNSDQAIMEDDDDDLLDEDELYEPSHRSDKRESVVTTPQSVAVEESTPPSTSSLSAVTPSKARNNNSKARRRLPIVDQLSDNTNTNTNVNANARSSASARSSVNTNTKANSDTHTDANANTNINTSTDTNTNINTNTNTTTNRNTANISISNNNTSNTNNINNNNDDNDNDNSKVSCAAGRRSSGSSNNGGSNGEIYMCLILNDITKQPCSAQFSRSYDLTRHRNTIHAKKKTVFRCSECIRMLGEDGYLKTFSRLDALTRHIKSKHENLSSERRQEVTKYAKENIGYVNS